MSYVQLARRAPLLRALTGEGQMTTTHQTKDRERNFSRSAGSFALMAALGFGCGKTESEVERVKAISSAINLGLSRGTKYCDFNGDGRCDLTVYRPSTGFWHNLSTGTNIVQGAGEDIPVNGDYDADGKADLGSYHPSTGVWTVVYSSTGIKVTSQWGAPEDIPVPGDYDGDGRFEYAVFRPSNGAWLMKKSNGVILPQKIWGTGSDIPVPGDYDFDQKTDFAYWTPSTGVWKVWRSASSSQLTRQWGSPSDIPVQGDYDADGRTDFAVWSPASGNWMISCNATGATMLQQWGGGADVPVPGDYDGDGDTDYAVWRPSDTKWYIISKVPVQWGAPEDLPISTLLATRRLRKQGDFDGDAKTDFVAWRPSTGVWATTLSLGSSTALGWGSPGDIPVPGDFDGDRKADRAVYNRETGNWYIVNSSSGLAQTPAVAWGSPGDIPVSGDFDGDRKSDFAVWHPATAEYYLVHSYNGAQVAITSGGPEDIPVPADYDGDGRSDAATFRPGTGNWEVKPSGGGATINTQWGMAGDVPVPGDYDGDGKADRAVWRPKEKKWIFIKSSTGAGDFKVFGQPRDVPLVADLDGDGKVNFAVYRPSLGECVWLRNDGVQLTITSGNFEDIAIPQAVSRRRQPGGTMADVDGDGKTDLTVRRFSSANFYSKFSSNGSEVAGPTSGEYPFLGDFDGDRKADFATYKQNTGTWKVLNTLSTLVGLTQDTQWGDFDDLPVPGDYDGDRVTDIAVWRRTTGEWIVINSGNGVATAVPWGAPEDIPLPGDYDGDGKTDMAAWRPSDLRWNISMTAAGPSTLVIGAVGDVPVAGDYDGDGKTDRGMWKPSTRQFTIVRSTDGGTSQRVVGTSADVPVVGDWDGDGRADFAVYKSGSGDWAIVKSTTGTETTTHWGSPGEIPAVLGPPIWPWYPKAATTTSLTAPTVAVGDAVATDPSYFWEFSSVAAPIGTTGCPNGARFMAGTGSGIGAADNRFFSSALTCAGVACNTDIVSRLALPVNTSSLGCDNILSRKANGNLLLLWHSVLENSFTHVGAQVWESSDCGTPWAQKATIDSLDTTRYPPPEFPADPNASYAKNQRSNGTPINGGWDRFEMLADPFSANNVYMTFSGNGGLPDNGANGAKWADGLLARSTDGGATWRSIPVPSGWPIMMLTSVPGRLFIFECVGGVPSLWWSDDNGLTLSKRERLTWNQSCGGDFAGVNLGRVSWSDTLRGDAVLRVTFPVVLADGRNALQVYNVSVSAAGDVNSRFIAELSASGKDISSATLIEPDPAMPGMLKENASVLYWMERSRPGVTPASSSVRGVLLKDELGMSPVFNVSTTTPTGTTLRTWANNEKTGDYIKGAFYLSAATSQLRYIVNWIEVLPTGQRELHSKVLAVPR
jgi:hypothetical protein